MTAGEHGYRSGLVDLAKGQLSRELFVNDEIYQQELERVFARAWLFVGHESQIANPGDFFVSSMGEESVILCRDRAGNSFDLAILSHDVARVAAQHRAFGLNA